jgi:DNA polymerase IV
MYSAGSKRTIVHMDLDAFFVSVERLLNSSLNGKPVIIGGNSDRAVVSSCSYEARAFGVRSAMPVKLARRLCPQAIIVRGDFEQYSKHSSMVTDIIAERSPLFEKASIDEHYIDMTGMDRFYGSMKWMHELRLAIMHETGLPISFGLSSNKTVSKIATGEAKPSGELEVLPPQVIPFLAPLSINKIPGIGTVTYRLLRSMGISTIDTLRNMPCELMERVLGENGASLWEKANGIDNTPVIPYSERKSMSSERTFERDTTDIARLNDILVNMVTGLAFDLRKSGKLTSCITVKIRYSNFDTHTQQLRIPYTSADHFLISKAKDLFTKLYNRRMLIRLTGVRFSHLVSGCQQISLFEDSVELAGLYQAMDRMRRRFGDKAIIRASGMRKSGSE